MSFRKIDQKISTNRFLFEGLHEDIDNLDYDLYTRFSDTLAARSGFDVEQLQDSVRLYSRPAGSASIFIISGQHGDERSGPIALLEMLRDDEFLHDMSIKICPIVNPAAWNLRTRTTDGLNTNRVWDARLAPAGVISLMMSIESQLPDVFLDLHESDEINPESGKLFELRHAGGTWGRAMMRALGPAVADVGIRSHVLGSAEKYAHELGVPGTAAVETNTLLPLSARVEFHKKVIRAAMRL